ncbi:MAG: carboxypeptidase regulatory-like domain-containing protein [Acidobacteria bacterium]|nr:carboxypeptidase regulatory-like domain-containing protein [Acidobacteriota bacterium]
MPRCLPVLAALLCSAALSEDATAQVPGRPDPIRIQASAGIVSGVVGQVTDEAGTGIGGASILAMGATLAVVRSDDQGRFRLELAPGPYILRATRDGYISTYREAVHIRTDAPLSRTITLLRADDAAGDVVLASITQPLVETPEAQPVEMSRPAPATPSDTAWRLRHLPRTVLRDEAFAPWRDDSRSLSSAASNDFTFADFNGRVDFLTTSALAASGELPADDWPRGVAYMVLGAPVGAHGDWSVRAAMTGGEASAWTITGEFASRTDRMHAFRAGASYSAQTLSDPAIRHSLAAIDTVRRVGGVHFVDQWSLPGGLDVDSRLRVEQYEYLAEPTLVSAHLGLRQQIAPRIFLVAAASPRMVAPGADQFAPPASAGVWLPAERTFSPLDRSDALRSQRVEAYEAGADAVLGRVAGTDADVTLRVRHFSEQSWNQIATIFGLDEASQVGHYYIASPGGVDLDGWLIGMSGQVAAHVTAAIDYRVTSAEWQRSESRLALRRVERSAARRGFEHLHDVTATVDATVPSTATRVNLALRLNSGFSRQDARTPGVGARFAVEVRQQLPGRLLGRGELNLLLAARTLLHELDTAGGFYNELLTVAPPVRLTCGLQMRF